LRGEYRAPGERNSTAYLLATKLHQGVLSLACTHENDGNMRESSFLDHVSVFRSSLCLCRYWRYRRLGLVVINLQLHAVFKRGSSSHRAQVQYHFRDAREDEETILIIRLCILGTRSY
jgi:hypothetical protein